MAGRAWRGSAFGEVTFEPRAERVEGVRHTEIRRKVIPGGGHSTCKGPEVERSWECLRNIEEGGEAGAG